MASHNRAVLLGCCGILLLAILQFILLPAWDYRQAMTRKVHNSIAALHDTEILAHQYTSLIQQRSELSKESNAQQGTLFALVEKVCRKLSISSAIDAIHPTQQALENNLIQETLNLRLKGLHQRSLTKFLYAVEHQLQGITVTNLAITRTKENLLDADFTLSMTTAAS